MRHAEALRRGKDSAALDAASALEEGCPLAEAIQSAVHGNASQLVQVLRICTVLSGSQSFLEGVIPRVTDYRKELAAVLRYNRTSQFLHAELDPASLVAEMARFRTSARLIGDTEDAEHWQRLIDNQAPLLTDRKLVSALAIWGHWGYFDLLRAHRD